jgi:hypothetical protein
MLPLHPHDLLLNIVVSLTSSTSTSGSPLGENGVLKKDLDYIFELEKFEEEYFTIFGRNFNPPDGFLRNTIKNISITVECKSDLNEEESNLEDQLEFYSNSEKFKEVFILEEETNEILIVCNENCFDSVIKILEKTKKSTNVIVWVAEKTPEDRFFVQKRYGDHTDDELNKIMSKGIFTFPPLSILLISPHISNSRFIAEIGKRLLSNLYKSKIDVDDFISKQNDSVIPYQRTKKTIKSVFTLIPELGDLEEDMITFKKQPKYNLIILKIEFIYALKKNELQYFLKKGSLTENDIENFEEMRRGQPSLEQWLRDNN